MHTSHVAQERFTTAQIVPDGRIADPRRGGANSVLELKTLSLDSVHHCGAAFRPHGVAGAPLARPIERRAKELPAVDVRHARAVDKVFGPLRGEFAVGSGSATVERCDKIDRNLSLRVL